MHMYNILKYIDIVFFCDNLLIEGRERGWERQKDVFINRLIRNSL